MIFCIGGGIRKDSLRPASLVVPAAAVRVPPVAGMVGYGVPQSLECGVMAQAGCAALHRVSQMLRVSVLPLLSLLSLPSRVLR